MTNITNQKLIYLICPVRNVTESEQSYLDNYVSSIEKLGDKVHYPPRDVNQVDSTGLRILSEHREAMKKSNEVHAYWNPSSSGSCFDFGMAFMAEKTPWKIINRDSIEVDKLNEFQSFIMMNSSFSRFSPNPASQYLNKSNDVLKYYIKSREQIDYVYSTQGLNPQSLFELGMIFMSEKPILIKNIQYLTTQRTPSKSFQNVLLELDNRYRKAL